MTYLYFLIPPIIIFLYANVFSFGLFLVVVVGWLGFFLVGWFFYLFLTSISTFRTEQLPDFLVDKLVRALQLPSLRKENSMSSPSLKPLFTQNIKQLSLYKYYVVYSVFVNMEKSGKKRLQCCKLSGAFVCLTVSWCHR